MYREIRPLVFYREIESSFQSHCSKQKIIFDHFSHDSSLIHSSSLSIPVFIISKNHSWPIPCMRFKSILIAEKFDADHVSHLPHNDHCYIYICRFIEFNPKPILMVILFYSY